MKAKHATLLAFILNASFSMIELLFGVLFHSSAVLADAVHDAGDAVAIGLSAFLENISNKKEDHRYTFGYKRFSLLGAMLTGMILITGSILVLVENIPKLFHPQEVNEKGMLWLGILAIVVNLVASFVIQKGRTRNEAILSLHFLEDILGWLAVILVSLVLHVTDWYILDPLLSLAISLFILSKALPQFWGNLKIFLAAVPDEYDLDAIEIQILALDNVRSINQLNIWSMDGIEHNAILHICLLEWSQMDETKQSIRHLLSEMKIANVTIEIDNNLKDHEAHKRDPKRFLDCDHSHHHHHH